MFSDHVSKGAAVVSVHAEVLILHPILQYSAFMSEGTFSNVAARVDWRKTISEDTRKCHNHETQPSRDTKRRRYKEQLRKDETNANR